MHQDFIFLILAVQLVLIAWPTNLRWVSWLLLADFCLFIGIDEYWFNSTLPGGDWMLSVKALVYFAFFQLYLISNAKILGLLSLLSALYHATYTLFDYWGIAIPYRYESVMTWYCILQLLVLYLEVLHGYSRGITLNWHWRNHHNTDG